MGSAGAPGAAHAGTTAVSLSLGAEAEAAAESYLTGHGLVPVARNYRAPTGEIDLVMRAGDYLVFVEVRARSHSAFGGAVASISAAKRRRVVRTAQHYLQRHRLGERQAVRFDVMALENNQWHWLPAAFDGSTT